MHPKDVARISPERNVPDLLNKQKRGPQKDERPRCLLFLENRDIKGLWSETEGLKARTHLLFDNGNYRATLGLTTARHIAQTQICPKGGKEREEEKEGGDNKKSGKPFYRKGFPL